jgi:hypothetical protein
LESVSVMAILRQSGVVDLGLLQRLFVRVVLLDCEAIIARLKRFTIRK